jgi:hypothetical protein
LEALNVKKFDLAFTVDPLFHKTSAQFDEGGARGEAHASMVHMLQLLLPTGCCLVPGLHCLVLDSRVARLLPLLLFAWLLLAPNATVKRVHEQRHTHPAAVHVQTCILPTGLP